MKELFHHMIQNPYLLVDMRNQMMYDFTLVMKNRN